MRLSLYTSYMNLHINKNSPKTKSSNLKQSEEVRSPKESSCVQAVISSREIGSMDRKSSGRGSRGPIWEVQCKQSQFFNHPSSRSELDPLWSSPSAPPPPSHPLLPDGRAEGQPRKHADSSFGQWRAQRETGRHWAECKRMWSGAGLTGVQSIARHAAIVTDVFRRAFKGKVNISKTRKHR